MTSCSNRGKTEFTLAEGNVTRMVERAGTCTLWDPTTWITGEFRKVLWQTRKAIVRGKVWRTWRTESMLFPDTTITKQILGKFWIFSSIFSYILKHVSRLRFEDFLNLWKILYLFLNKGISILKIIRDYLDHQTYIE